MPKCKTCKSVVSIKDIYGDKCINCLSSGESKDLLKLKRKIRIKEYENIDFQIENTKNELANAKTNNILHLILSLVTAGFWLIIWFLVSLGESHHKKKLQKKLEELYVEKKKLEDMYNKEKEIKLNMDKNIIDDLTKLSALLDKGHITQEEYISQKDKLINSS